MQLPPRSMDAVARVLRAGRRRLLTYDSRMSESMRLANEYKADRVDQFYAALHETAFGTSGHGVATNGPGNPSPAQQVPKDKREGAPPVHLSITAEICCRKRA